MQQHGQPNPLHVQIALQETEVQVKMMSSRAQQLAIELFEARQLNAMAMAELEAERKKNAELEAKNAGHFVEAQGVDFEE